MWYGEQSKFYYLFYKENKNYVSDARTIVHLILRRKNMRTFLKKERTYNRSLGHVIHNI